MPRESTVKGKPMSDGSFPTAVRESRYPHKHSKPERERERVRVGAFEEKFDQKFRVRRKIIIIIIKMNEYNLSDILEFARIEIQLPAFPHGAKI